MTTNSQKVESQRDQPIKVGDYVRFINNDKYLGKVVSEHTVRVLTIIDDNGYEHGIPDDVLEVAPKLTPDEAWAELPYLILGQLNKWATYVIQPLGEDALKLIRHEAYKLLGGAGIKVTVEVKERVRKAISRIADAMGVELD